MLRLWQGDKSASLLEEMTVVMNDWTLVWSCSTDLHCLRTIASGALSGSVGSEVVLAAGVFDGYKGVDTAPERDLALRKRWVLMHSLVSPFETSGSGVPSPSTLKLIKVCRPRMDCL